MPKNLSIEEVSTALEALPGWEGGPDRLVRTVPVEAQDEAKLRDAIGAVADEIDHHPELQTTADGLHIAVWTHTTGGVTSRDVELATRLDRLLAGGVAWDKY